MQAVGVPKTIDNDLSETEFTFGFDTAVQIATEAIDRLRTTAESHHRVIVCEVMGRHAGWIAAYCGIAGGAAEILVPELPFDVDAVCSGLRDRHAEGQFSSIVVVSEGATPAEGPDAEAARSATATDAVDAFGHARLGGIGDWLAREIETRTGFESRTTILGHVQRGGTPTAHDRVLATRFGSAAVAAVHDGAFGMMVALKDGDIVRVPIADAVRTPKTCDLRLIVMASGLRAAERLGSGSGGRHPGLHERHPELLRRLLGRHDVYEDAGSELESRLRGELRPTCTCQWNGSGARNGAEWNTRL